MVAGYRRWWLSLCDVGTRYNNFLLEPFAAYNFGDGCHLLSIPIITANWCAAGNKAWTLPVGAEIGKVVKIGGKLPVNLQVGAYYNALRPEHGAPWQLRTQIAIVF